MKELLSLTLFVLTYLGCSLSFGLGVALLAAAVNLLWDDVAHAGAAPLPAPELEPLHSAPEVIAGGLHFARVGEREPTGAGKRGPRRRRPCRPIPRPALPAPVLPGPGITASMLQDPEPDMPPLPWSPRLPLHESAITERHVLDLSPKGESHVV